MNSGIDTYNELVLEKRQSTVTGTFTFVGFPGIESRYPVTGTTALGRVLLRWTENGHNITFDATLPSASSNELTGRMSYDGGAPSEPITFIRSSRPSL